MVHQFADRDRQAGGQQRADEHVLQRGPVFDVPDVRKPLRNEYKPHGIIVAAQHEKIDEGALEEADDPAAVEIINQVIRLISINLGGVVNTLDLHMIVMGGGVVNASTDFVLRINSRIRDFLETEEAKRDFMVVNETFPNAAIFGSAADFFVSVGFLPAL